MAVRTAGAAAAEWARGGGGGRSWVVERLRVCAEVVFTQVYTTVKANQNTHFKSMHFIVCKLYLGFQKNGS